MQLRIYVATFQVNYFYIPMYSTSKNLFVVAHVMYKLVHIKLAMYFSEKTYLCTNEITNKTFRRQVNNCGSFYFFYTHVMLVKLMQVNHCLNVIL